MPGAAAAEALATDDDLRPGLALVVVVALVAAGIHLAAGPGWVLDDWYALANARLDGALAAAGADQQQARPGAALVYAVAFGLLGDHPAVVVAVQGALAAATAVLLCLLLRRFVPVRLAVLVAVLWVVLPNHVSLEVWPSATNIALALALALGGLLVLVGEELGPRRGALAAVLLAAATLCYEAVVPAAAVGAVALPWLATGRVRWSAVAWAWSGLGLASLWILLRWHPAKEVQPWLSLDQVIGGHLSWGIVPEGPAATAALLVGLVGILLTAARLADRARRRRATPAAWLVVAGLAVVALGVLPFVRYFYAPAGAGDRVTVVSAVGGAMIWAGLVAQLWAVRRWLGWAALGLLVVAASVARVERSQRWHRAGDDGVAVLDAIEDRWPEPPIEVVVVGPHPVQEGNVAAFIDQSNLRGAVQQRYGVADVEVVLTFSEREWLDWPADQRIDVVALSSLEGDADVRPG